MKHEVKVNVPEGLKERVDRVKQHLKDNRTTYLVGAGCLTVGYLLRKPQTIKVISNGAAPVFNNTVKPVMNNVVHNTVNNGGHMTKIVKRVSDGDIWETVTEAAELASMAFHFRCCPRHLNGHKPDVSRRDIQDRGYRYYRLIDFAGKTCRIMRPIPFVALLWSTPHLRCFAVLGEMGLIFLESDRTAHPYPLIMRFHPDHAGVPL